jgi:hypothetical protein
MQLSKKKTNVENFAKQKKKKRTTIKTIRMKSNKKKDLRRVE